MRFLAIVVDEQAVFFLYTISKIMNQGAPQLPDRPGYSRRPGQPLRLPSFTTINGQNGVTVPQQQHVQPHQSQQRHPGKRRSGSSMHGDSGRNALYTSMLENIEVDDMEVLAELVDKLMEVRSENENLKKAMWGRVSALSEKVNNGDFGEVDSTSVEELRKVYEEKKNYNAMLKETVEQYEEEIERVLSTAVAAKVEAGNALIGKIREENNKVEDATDEMWKGWNRVATVLDEAGKLAQGVSKSMKYVGDGSSESIE